MNQNFRNTLFVENAVAFTKFPIVLRVAIQKEVNCVLIANFHLIPKQVEENHVIVCFSRQLRQLLGRRIYIHLLLTAKLSTRFQL